MQESKPLNIPVDAKNEMIAIVEDVVRKGNFKANGICCGFKECARAIEEKKAFFCFLAANCDLKEYKELIEKLCIASDIPLVICPDKRYLGFWAGLNKKGMGFQNRKKHNCSCLCVKKVPEDVLSFTKLMDEFKKIAAGQKKVITVKGEVMKEVKKEKAAAPAGKDDKKGGKEEKKEEKKDEKKKK